LGSGVNYLRLDAIEFILEIMQTFANRRQLFAHWTVLCRASENRRWCVSASSGYTPRHAFGYQPCLVLIRAHFENHPV